MSRSARSSAVESDAGAADVSAFYSLVAESGARTLAVIGLVKNAGKTTVVNALMERTGLRLGLTSLGLDGERTDHLTGLAKPRIAPPKGTLIATTRGSLDRSRYAMEILEELPCHTPLGRVLIGVAPGTGQVEISGPTTLSEVRETADRLLELGAEQVLVDGAINRLGSASPRVADGVILATGGMVADSLDEIADTTAAILTMLTLPEVAPEARSLLTPDVRQSARAIAVDEAGHQTRLELETVVGEGVTVAREVERLNAKTLFIGGALTQEFADDFLRILPPRRKLRIIVRDATVLVMPPATVLRFGRRGISLEVLDALRVLAMTANPFRVPQPYHPKMFFDAIAAAVGDRVPLFDVVNGFASLPPCDAQAGDAISPRKKV